MVTDNNGTNLTSFNEIQKYITNFYKNLYTESTCDTEKQDYFLSFLTNGLSDSDREFLSSPLSTSEIYSIIKTMEHNKTPGVMDSQLNCMKKTGM